jgi:hypothetical protein
MFEEGQPDAPGSVQSKLSSTCRSRSQELVAPARPASRHDRLGNPDILQDAHDLVIDMRAARQRIDILLLFGDARSKRQRPRGRGPALPRSGHRRRSVPRNRLARHAATSSATTASIAPSRSISQRITSPASRSAAASSPPRLRRACR